MKPGGQLKRDPEKLRAFQERGRQPLRKDPEKAREFAERGRASSAKSLKKSARRRGGISPASPPQREKVANALCIVTGQEGCDPMHLLPRSLGGCDDPLCVVPATRQVHYLYEEGKLDILPALLARGLYAEIAHLTEAHHQSPKMVLERLTGLPYVADELSPEFLRRRQEGPAESRALGARPEEH